MKEFIYCLIAADQPRDGGRAPRGAGRGVGGPVRDAARALPGDVQTTVLDDHIVVGEDF